MISFATLVILLPVILLVLVAVLTARAGAPTADRAIELTYRAYGA